MQNTFKRILDDWQAYGNDQTVLIYQMGKVGSTTLEETISKNKHIHSFYGHWPCRIQYIQRRNSFYSKIKQSFYDSFRRTAVKFRKQIKIISLVRDPYPRNISMFFQNFPHWFYYYYFLKKYNKYETISTLHDVFNEAFDHDYALYWFDKELKRFTGIDIFKYDFDKKIGSTRITKGKFDLLIVKLEALNKNWALIEDFVGQKLEFKTANSSEDKWYRDVYENFKMTYMPKASYLDKLYNSKLVRHFYMDDEVENFRQKALRIKNHG